MTMSPRGFRVARLVFSLFIGLAAASTGWAQSTVEKEIATTRTRIEAARGNSLALIAPKSFRQATEQFQQAEARYAKGGKIEEIRSALGDVNKDLARAEALEEVGKIVLRDALKARTDAQTAKSPALTEELWANAEKKITEAGAKLESGDQNSARSEATKAVTLFRDAEFLAIRTDILGTAWTLRDEAGAQKAAERASVTLGGANDLLSQAENLLTKDRYARDAAVAKARLATDAYQHTLKICDQVAAIENDRKAAPEKMILAYEAQVARVAKATGVDAKFTEGVAPVADQIVAATASVAKERDDLRSQLALRQTDLESTRARVATLSGRDAVLQQKEQHELKMQEVQAVFKHNEADVLLRGDEMTIRMYALSFPVGSSEIRPENFAMLSRINQVLKQFPNAHISIEGNTDSQGSDETNQALSQARANAVREYLLASMSIDPTLVSATGFGESRPIANNETEEGRAKNRRIDLRFSLSES